MKTKLEILRETLDEVLEEYRSLCLDNECERAFLKGLIIGTFCKLENKDFNNENS